MKTTKIRNVFGNRYFGALGGDVIASSWKGRRYLKAYAKPRNPRTELQQQHRQRFAQAVAAWKALPADRRAAYDRAARGMSGYNLFIGRFLRTVVEESPFEEDEAIANMAPTESAGRRTGLDQPEIPADRVERPERNT